MTFRDLFSASAPVYAQCRPMYPSELFSRLAALTPRHDRAWDCATGNGQAAVALAELFTHVAASDASIAQLRHARRHPRVTYHADLATASAVRDESVDLVTVAQALHWFDLNAFYAEARRVLVPGGAIAAWSYDDPALDDPAANAILQRFNHETLGAYWPSERHSVGVGYRTYPFPFDEIAIPEMTLEATWTLAQLGGYIRSWSATSRYVAQHGGDPVDDFEREMAPVWGDLHRPVAVRWPLIVRAGRTQ